MSTTEPNISLPAGATTDGWLSVDRTGQLVRSLTWQEYESVSVDGSQTADGTITRGITIYSNSYQSMTAAEARGLARELLQAADALEQLNSSDGEGIR